MHLKVPLPRGAENFFARLISKVTSRSSHVLVQSRVVPLIRRRAQKLDRGSALLKFGGRRSRKFGNPLKDYAGCVVSVRSTCPYFFASLKINAINGSSDNQFGSPFRLA